MVMAESLEAAAPRTFVHVDQNGQVRSPARYKALQALSYGAAGAIVAGVTGIYGALLGPPGVLIGLGLGAWVGWQIRRGLKLQEATRLLVHDRLDEAEALLNQILKSWRVPKGVRALAAQNLGAVYTRRGNYEEALKHQRAAMLVYAKMRKKSPFAHTVGYSEMTTLVNLGRHGEARQRFEQLQGVVPAGDYLRLQHWAAELYICLAEGEHRISSDDLHERSHVALGITGAAALLGLCAWAHVNAKDKDTDQAWHLLREAFDRKTGTGLERGLPKLWTWMQEHRAEAGVPEPEPEPEPEAARDPDA
jgi:tetratricopeptide (TPR) repeat protein